MSTRRKGSPPPEEANGDIPTTTEESSTTRPTTTKPTRSPFIPTSLETLLIGIYPITLILGSLFSTFSPNTRNAPYSALLQSHPPSSAPSYFAQKKNIFNLYFVKVGWFWTTLALAVFVATNPSLGPPLRPVFTRRRIQAWIRWALVTLLWTSTTQWFFGPALIDRGFRITGGACQFDPELGGEVKQLFSASECKRAGGQWKGGHDISGHVFLLILGSALLWHEILPAIMRAEGLRDGRTVLMDDGSIRSAADLKGQLGVKDDKERKVEVTQFGVKAVIAIVALMWWMLLMTAAFFHTWVEKTTGLVVAFAGLYLIYFVPRAVPGMRAIVGMPGV